MTLLKAGRFSDLQTALYRNCLITEGDEVIPSCRFVVDKLNIHNAKLLIAMYDNLSNSLLTMVRNIHLYPDVTVGISSTTDSRS